MEPKHLINAIVQQTTVLIAQLSTAAGIRAPLAQLADQVFLELSRELEAQGVTRKVAADMFGLALRSYQKKIQRISESATQRDRTLWEVVLEHLRKRGGASRKSLSSHFKRESALDLAAVLKDLTSSGLISATGRGTSTYYQVASPEARASVTEEAGLDVVAHWVWLAVYDHQQIARSALLAELPFDDELGRRAIRSLLEDGRIAEQPSAAAAAAGSSSSVEDDSAMLSCAQLQIPIGAEQGWEAAVFDHFRAMANAIGAKLRTVGARSSERDRVGGTTLSFSVYAGHPNEREVYGLLQRVRGELNELWNRVSEYNRIHVVDPDRRVDVTFYFGQHVIAADVDVEHAADTATGPEHDASEVTP